MDLYGFLTLTSLHMYFPILHTGAHCQLISMYKMSVYAGITILVQEKLSIIFIINYVDW